MTGFLNVLDPVFYLFWGFKTLLAFWGGVWDLVLNLDVTWKGKGEVSKGLWRVPSLGLFRYGLDFFSGALFGLLNPSVWSVVSPPAPFPRGGTFGLKRW